MGSDSYITANMSANFNALCTIWTMPLIMSCERMNGGIVRDVEATGTGELPFSSFDNVETGRSSQFSRLANSICALNHILVSCLTIGKHAHRKDAHMSMHRKYCLRPLTTLTYYASVELQFVGLFDIAIQHLLSGLHATHHS